MYNIKKKDLGNYDIAVCGGGIAGVCAAVSAAREGAKVILLEKGGSLGGTLTEGYVPQILDGSNKGGLVKELFDFLNAHQMTCSRVGAKADTHGNRIPGSMIDTEGAKYFFDKICAESGVKVLFHSQVMAADVEAKKIREVLVATECCNYVLKADVFIDATGNGIVADFAGCEWECGDPSEGRVSPTSMGICVTGMPADYNGTDTGEEKTAYAQMLLKHGINISTQQATVVKMPSLQSWSMGVNFGYNAMPDDIHSLSEAVIGGRKEAFEIVEKHKKIPGYERLNISFSSSHVGVREGRRIFGEYRISDEDILTGRKFEDGICTVTFGVDVHKLKSDDTLSCQRGYKAIPYHIPYRSLIPKDCDNLMLAGRCISGDFYPHASDRVMGNMAATGEAGGYAAALCVKECILPREFDGKRVSAFMKKRGYEI